MIEKGAVRNLERSVGWVITAYNATTPTLLDGYRYISPLTGGLPRQCAHWLAMTAKRTGPEFTVYTMFVTECPPKVFDEHQSS